MPEHWSGQIFEVRVRFRAPLPFVYRWCTDYTPQDPQYEKDDYQRRILRRSSRKVVYEDLSVSKEGWVWSHAEVRLLPPNGWHSDSVGSHRQYSVDYRLKELPGARTEMTLRARRRPYGIGAKNPSKAAWEKNIRKLWRNFGRVLERDYRKVKARRARR
jgi:hypothetical protein